MLVDATKSLNTLSTNRLNQPYKVFGNLIKGKIVKCFNKVNIKICPEQVKSMLLTSETASLISNNKKYLILTRSDECFYLTLFVNLTDRHYCFWFNIRPPMGLDLRVEETFEESSKHVTTIIPNENKKQEVQESEEDQFDVIFKEDIVPSSNWWNALKNLIIKI